MMERDPGVVERTVARVLGGMVHRRYRSEAVGDVLEEYATEVLAHRSRARAILWLAVQLARTACASRWHARGLDDPVAARVTRRRGGFGMGGLVRDVRYAVRTLVRAPLFTAVAVVTLALGIGAAVAVFAVVNAVLFAPLPYPDADRVVHVQGDASGRHAVTYPDYVDLRASASSFADLAVWQGWRITVRESDGIRSPRPAASVSANFFGVLGAVPAAGRFFMPEDGAPGHAPVVVLSHSTWQREFGGRADAIGETFQTDGVAYTIVGVAQPGLVDPVWPQLGADGPAMWRAHPPAFDSARADRGWVGFWVIGRLQPGVTVARAQAEVEQQYRAAYPEADIVHAARVVPVREAAVRDVRPTLVILLAAVALVLLVGCANVANLLLSRATSRVREVAIRTAMGASRRRLVGQMLVESVLLSLLGAAAGLAFALAGVGLLERLAVAQLASVDIGIDARVASFAVVVALITAAVFGLAPALQLTASRFSIVLREGSRGETVNTHGRRLGRTIVIAEVALAVVLLVAAGLLLRSVWALQRVDPGFDAGAKLAVRLGLPGAEFDGAADQVATVDRLLRELSAMPGVTGAGAITDLPLSGAVNSTVVRRADLPEPAPSERTSVLVRAITPDYLPLMRVPIVRGRGFGADDRAGAPPVAVVNEAFARRFFPGEDVLGRSVVVRGVTREIVGIASNVKEFTLSGGDDFVLYEPYAQENEAWMRESVWLVVGGSAADALLTARVRSTISDVDPAMTVSAARTVASFVDAEYSGPRFRATVILLFAASALGLAATGVGGVMAYAVSQRSREIGVRIALGARSGDVTRMVLAESARITIAGLAIGLAGSIVAARSIAAFLFGVTTRDPVVFAGVALLLGIVALAAGYLPARRASRADPLAALRGE